MGRWPTWRQKAVTFERLEYEPNVAQLPIHRCNARAIVVAGAERAGKSRTAGTEVVARMPWCKRVGFVAQEYDKARAEFVYVLDALTELGAMGHSSTPRRGQWAGESLTGCEFLTISLERGTDELTGTGMPFDIIVLCEWGLIAYNAFLAARGRVAETRGTVFGIGTLRDNVGWQADLWRLGQGLNDLGVVSYSLPAWANLALFPGGRDDPEILDWRRSLNDEDESARRIDAEVRSSPARMFPAFDHVLHVQEWAAFDSGEDVYVVADAGYYPSRYAVLAVQFRKDPHGREIVVVVDEIWEHNKVHEEILDMVKARPWATNVVQAIGGHESKQHQATASMAEVWEAVWPGLYFETFDAGAILPGASRVRWLLNPGDLGPRLILSPGCDGTAWEFGHYMRKTDRQGNVISEQPEDRNNDAMDALRNLVVWRYGPVDRDEVPQESQAAWGNPYG